MVLPRGIPSRSRLMSAMRQVACSVTALARRSASASYCAQPCSAAMLHPSHSTYNEFMPPSRQILGGRFFDDRYFENAADMIELDGVVIVPVGH